MKREILSKLGAFISCGLLYSTCCVCEYLSPNKSNGEAATNYKLASNKDEDYITVNLDVNGITKLELIKTDEIANIEYSDDKMFVTVYMKDVDIYYSGYYDANSNQYFYTKVCEKNKVYTKSN